MAENISALTIKTSEDDIMAAIQKNGFYIDRVEKTPDRCLAAVRQTGRALEVIPKALHTSELCLEAVKQNGQALKCASKKVITYDICMEAVKNDGEVLAFVSDKFYTLELFVEAIKQNGKALRYIPETIKSEKICMQAVKQNGLALEFVPQNILSKELYLSAVEQNGLALEYVPSSKKNKGLCVAAVTNNALALEYVPNRFKSSDLCNMALQQDLRAFLYFPETMCTLERCFEVLELLVCRVEDISEISYSIRSTIRNIVECLPEDVHNDVRIIALERKLGARRFKEKSFDVGINKFVTKEFVSYREDDEISEFTSFTEFYEHLGGNLENANLYDYNFKGINLSDFNIVGAYINSAVLIEQNLYDDSFFSKNIKDSNGNAELLFSVENEVVEAIAVLHETDLDLFAPALNDRSRKIFYISDIHLNHKLKKQFPLYATEQEARQYIQQLVKKMIATATDNSYDDYLLIGGDVSFNFEISKLFYSELAKCWSARRIVVILGNHELWDFSNDGSESECTNALDEIIQRYREMLSDLGVKFLYNGLLISNEERSIIISEEQLDTISSDELKGICLKSSLVILGGLGYSGLNPDFNATHGIYRETIKSLDEDIKQTERFNHLYDKINDALGSSQIIVFTHAPKENWSNTNHNCNWIYVNGHTHRNEYYYSGEKTIYADNQIGYYSSSIGLKSFKTSKIYDTFKYYTDGIYIISREQYLDFNRGVGINVTFNRIGKVYMLKKSGVYCFIFENTDTGKNYLLSGGTITNLEHDDINYYYERMAYYSDSIKGLFSGYHNAMKLIAEAVKKIGGAGTIHGCIVDIDFYNHIFVNPTDGTITPYFALSVVHKFMYPDINALLLEQRSDLYDKYIKLTGDKSEGIRLLKGESDIAGVDVSKYISDTHMYSPSRIMKSIQYLTDVNVIRIWNDKVMNIRTPIEREDEGSYIGQKGTLMLP